MEFKKKISAYLMTALMLVATTNIVLSAHICSGELYSISLIKESTSCCNSTSGNEWNLARTGNLALSDGNFCCSSKTLEAKGVDILYPSIGIRNIDLQPAVLQLEIFERISFPVSDVQTSVFKPYLTHFADQDIPLMVQSFLL